MKSKIKEVFYCDHCKKHGLSKKQMEYHETICSKNPVNDRPCLHCQNLEMKDVVYYEYFGDNDRKVNLSLFYCTKKDVYLYPPKVEIKNNPKDFGETNEPMPQECDLFEKW